MRTTPQTTEQLTPLFLSQILAHDVVARTIQRIGQDVLAERRGNPS